MGEKEFVKFESINLERANDIARRFPKYDYRVTRAEVVLTNKCQLKCSYCKKHLSENDYENRVDKTTLIKCLTEWLENGCRFVHFTGVEATLCEELFDYVKLCNKYGAEVTLSTNGNSDIEVYDNLIKAGVNGFHISMDTLDRDEFDIQVGVKGAFDRAIKTIKFVTKMRDEYNYKTHLVINTCITPLSFSKLKEILRYMLDLKPDDIKLIPIAQFKEKWVEYEEEYEKDIYPELIKMVPHGNKFNMLRSRLNNLVKLSFRGYNNKRQVPPCYLSADERTVDPEGNYYGCYINYREGADPVGKLQYDSFIQQSEKLRDNMLNFTKSDVCQKYCADITVLCNKYIDEKVHEYELARIKVSENE
ncbi:cyclic pyranopterin monophosphate synthase subunit MoaA [Hathewaya proteolytica DSM 3090]|uniref:Cyclic pyranopterin monophosphate synthase subunit MoaA n=1 Tax=Hathewaya proteolytica DSM 3090 TaxID=1121331 RepID=A0A1M6K5H4_9CLOT|nr:radical SAM protein [Hathewaya proteolytica]SHJ54147.1 cyclic pyranopterin monophosphate synthase subunit MoaA [Hathewaya proteolytica DSM 3090]